MSEEYHSSLQDHYNRWDEETAKAQPLYADRDYGILTTREREYLLGIGDEMSTNQESTTKSRIRKRVRDAVLDFRILQNELSTEEKDKIFNNLIKLDVGSSDGPKERGLTDRDRRRAGDIPEKGQEKAGKTPPGNVSGCATDMVGFIYHYTDNPSSFSNRIEEAITKVARQEGWICDVNVDIEIELKESHAEALERLEEHGIGYDSVSMGTLRELKEAGEITPEKFREYKEKRYEEVRDRRLYGSVSEHALDNDEEKDEKTLNDDKDE